MNMKHEEEREKLPTDRHEVLGRRGSVNTYFDTQHTAKNMKPVEEREKKLPTATKGFYSRRGSVNTYFDTQHTFMNMKLVEEESEQSPTPPKEVLGRRGSVQTLAGPMDQSLLDLEIQCDIQDLVLTGNYAVNSTPDETSPGKEKDISQSTFNNFPGTTSSITKEPNKQPLLDRKIKGGIQNLEILDEDDVRSSPNDTTPDKQIETVQSTKELIKQPLAHVEPENDQRPTNLNDNLDKIEAAIPQDTPSQDTPWQDTPSQDTPSQDAPSQDTPSQDTPSQDTPSQDAPSQDTPSQDTPSQDTPSQDTPSQDTPSQDTPSQDTFSQDTPWQRHTLKAFAINHFSPQHKRTLINSIKQRTGDGLWSHSKKPIKQPLLKKLLHNPELTKEACSTFEYIMKYMEDLPTKKSFRRDMELTDCIFNDALQNEHLKDEVFCQIIKQLTDNKYKISVERGWELMWLATGIFSCSQTIMPEVTKFLRSVDSQLSTDCIQRLKKISKGGQRKYPPHLVELEAIRHFTTQIFHMVYFPNDTTEAIGVDSCVTGKEFCTLIGHKLKLKSVEGFSLFFMMADKVISIPEKYYFFDFVRHFNDLMKKALFSGDKSKTVRTYQLFFMKKLWINTFPGQDITADVMFHYHQELPKFLRGYHKCSKDEAAELGALQYHVRFGKDTSELENIPKMLKELLPNDMVTLVSPKDWKKSIVKEYQKHASKSQKEAKIAFLQILYLLPTFGSAFFEIKQISEPKYPKKLLLFINRLGVSLMDPKTKRILASFKFNQIASWKCGNTFFNMTIGTQAGEIKLLCETTLGYKLEDMLSSYIRLIKTSIKKKLGAGGRRKSGF